MDDSNDEKKPRKQPGAPFFMVAMACYLVLVHGTSLLGANAGMVHGAPQYYPDTWPWLNAVLNALGGASAQTCALVALPVLYGCMLCVFKLTRQLVGGPPWLGSLAGSFLMAHPVKTEILFSPTGLYYSIATLSALLATLAYVQLRVHGGYLRYAIALALYTCATMPFTVNAVVFSVFILMEYLVGDPEKRNLLRPVPFAIVTMVANWFHLDTVYAVMPTPDTMFGPLLLFLYPIGLLPETLYTFQASPWEAWFWGGVGAACVVGLFVYVKTKPFRLFLLSVVFFRFYPGALPIDYVTLDGGGQLFYPLALTGVALAALSAWLLRFEAWRKPTVALTTIVCLVLFVLQFQANRAYVKGMSDVEESAAVIETSLWMPPSVPYAEITTIKNKKTLMRRVVRTRDLGCGPATLECIPVPKAES